jgi:spore maturation protein CgeB
MGWQYRHHDDTGRCLLQVEYRMRNRAGVLEYAMIRAMQSPRLKVSGNLKKLMDYPRMAGETPRMLILESQYWLDAACGNAGEKLGWAVERAPVLMQGFMPRDMVATLIHRLAEFRPDFILAINLSGMDEGGLFAQLFADLEIPLVSWFVDDPRTIIMDRKDYATTWSLALTWEKAYEDALTAAGFLDPVTLPLAVDTTQFDGDPADRCAIDSAFVGNSMKAFAAQEWDWLRAHPALAGGIETAFQTGRITRENFARGLSALLEAGLLETLDADQRRHAELYFFIEGTRRLRAALVHELEAEGLIVRGDEGWREETGNYQPFVNYSRDLAGFYRECAVNLNTTSIQMASAVNQRVFDCPAAGGFLLTDAQAALEELFDPETELTTWRSLDECRDKLRFYRDHPKARKDIIRNARRRILAEHTYENRLEKIAALVRDRFYSA